jgi:NAD(P) transhydrogenase
MPSETREYDLVIIGGGPAGIVAAATAKGCHKTVALVDSHRDLGGTGVNTGTVPSKTLRETALALSGIKARRLVGVGLSLKYEATVTDFLRHEQEVKIGFNSMISQQLKAEQADVFFGTAAFVDAHTVRVKPGQSGQPLGQPLGAGGEVLLHG